jgi:hypothetical protein
MVLFDLGTARVNSRSGAVAFEEFGITNVIFKDFVRGCNQSGTFSCSANSSPSSISPSSIICLL